MADAATDWNQQLLKEEASALESFTSGELPPSPGWIYDIDLGQESDESLDRIVEVVRSICSMASSQWPTDDEWRELLPVWFIKNTPSYSRDESQELLNSTPKEKWHLLPWDLGSWLDAIKVREWHWWSYKRLNTRLRIYLKLTGWPANLEAFEHIITAAGATVTDNKSL